MTATVPGAIVEAVADVAYQNAERFAQEAVAGDRAWASPSTSAARTRRAPAGSSSATPGRTTSDPGSTPERKLVEVPKPAGVILALTPSTNPIATTYFKVLCALMTRNAVVVSPHPMARRVSAEAVALMARAAVAAGAPDGCLQVVEEPTVPLIEALMADPETDLIVATGGTAVVRAAYHSGNPALGVGPGNVPALVDASGRHRPRRRLPGRVQVVRQLDPLHQRVDADRRAGDRRRADRRARARAAAPCSTPSPTVGSATPATRRHDRHRAWSARTRARSRRPQGSGCRRGRRVLIAPFRADRPRGAARAREAVSAARHGPRARRAARDRRRPGAAADRRRRSLGRHPLAHSGGDPRLRRRRARAADQRQRARAAPARPGSTRTSRRR